MLRSDLHQMIQKTTAKFVRQEIAPQAKLWDQEHRFPRENLVKLAQAKMVGMRVPRKYGGSGQGLFESVLVLEQMAMADASTAILLHVQHNASPLYILKYGGKELQKELLPKLAAGEILFSMAQTEPEVGSNLNELSTTARPDGDYYVVNGAKNMISLGRSADVHLVYVRFTDDDSIGCLLVRKGTEGLYQGGHEDFMGLRGLDTGELVFKDCRVPRSEVLLKGPGALRNMLVMFNGTRVGLSAISMGIATAAFREAVRYAQERIIGGKPLIQYQGTQWKLADLAVKLEGMRSMIYSAAKEAGANGFPSQYSSSLVKIAAVEGAIEISSAAIGILGGYGYSKEYPVERYLRDARGTAFIGGTPEVMKNAVGAHLMKNIP